MRLFAGIALDEGTRAACTEAQDRLRRAAFEARYEAPENLHLTLAFLGNVPDEQLPALSEALHGVASRQAPFDLVLDRLGAFPNERRPRIVFAGARDQGAAFRALAESARDAFRAFGFSFDEDPVAHVTLARVRGGSHRPLPLISFAARTLHVAGIALFESLPRDDAARYEIRAAARLARPPRT